MPKNQLFLRLLCLALCLGLLLTIAAFAADAAVDPLVTLGYLTGTFTDDMTQRMQAMAAQAVQETQTEFEAQLEDLAQAVAARETGTPASAGYETLTLAAGQSCLVEAGTELLLLSGSAAASTALTDATAGALIAAGTALEPYHFYVGVYSGTLTAAQDASLLLK